MKFIRESFKPLRSGYKLGFVFILMVSLIVTLIPVVNAKVLGLIVENIQCKEHALKYVYLLASVLLISAFLTFVLTAIKNKYRYNIEYEYKKYTEKRLMTSAVKYIKNQPEGDIVSRMSMDINGASGMMVDGFLPFVQKIFLIIASIVVIALINLKTILFLLPIVFVSLLLQVITSRPLHPKRKVILEKYSAVSSIASDGVSSYNQVKTNSLEDWMLSRFSRALDAIWASYKKIFPVMVIFMSLSFFFAGIPLVFLMFYGSHLVVTGAVSISNFILIITVGVNITTMITSLSQTVAGLQSLSASFSRVFEIWDSPREDAQFKDLEKHRFVSPSAAGSGSLVSMKNIDFSYSEERPILKDFNYNFERGKKYIVLGRNGTGKSTLISLISALYSPSAGSISYAFKQNSSPSVGAGFASCGLTEFRKKISVAEQNTYLIDGTVEENIFTSGKSKENISKWLSETYFKSIIDEFVNGIDTKISASGEGLSGGQKRCISIARAMVRNTDLLILDEPTANVDSKTADLINKEIMRMSGKQNKTIIMITHDENLVDIGEDIEKIYFSEISQLEV